MKSSMTGETPPRPLPASGEGTLRIVRATRGVGFLLLAACGGSTPPPVTAPEPEAPAPVRHGPRLAVQGELGEIDQAATEKTFGRLGPTFMKCYQEGQGRVEYLSGDVKFFLRVAVDGSAKWVFLEQSTLGDRETERCMLDAIRGAHWPQPTGGEAEVHKGLGFDAPGNVRPPFEWNPDRVAEALGKHGDLADKCKEGASGTFHVTAYVTPHGKGGKVLAVGVAPPSSDGEDKIDCLVDVVKKMKMPSPGSWAAKVSFVL
jgi:hypothetical protein